MQVHVYWSVFSSEHSFKSKVNCKSVTENQIKWDTAQFKWKSNENQFLHGFRILNWTRTVDEYSKIKRRMNCFDPIRTVRDTFSMRNSQNYLMSFEIIVSSLKGGTGLTIQYSFIFRGGAYFQDSVLCGICISCDCVLLCLHCFIGTTHCGIGKFPQFLLYFVSLWHLCYAVVPGDAHRAWYHDKLLPCV